MRRAYDFLLGVAGAAVAAYLLVGAAAKGAAVAGLLGLWSLVPVFGLVAAVRNLPPSRELTLWRVVSSFWAISSLLTVALGTALICADWQSGGRQQLHWIGVQVQEYAKKNGRYPDDITPWLPDKPVAGYRYALTARTDGGVTLEAFGRGQMERSHLRVEVTRDSLSLTTVESACWNH